MAALPPSPYQRLVNECSIVPDPDNANRRHPIHGKLGEIFFFTINGTAVVNNRICQALHRNLASLLTSDTVLNTSYPPLQPAAVIANGVTHRTSSWGCVLKFVALQHDTSRGPPPGSPLIMSSKGFVYTGRVGDIPKTPNAQQQTGMGAGVGRTYNCSEANVEQALLSLIPAAPHQHPHAPDQTKITIEVRRLPSNSTLFRDMEEKHSRMKTGPPSTNPLNHISQRLIRQSLLRDIGSGDVNTYYETRRYGEGAFMPPVDDLYPAGLVSASYPPRTTHQDTLRNNIRLGFTDYAAYSAWGNNVNAQVAAVQRNGINAYINNAVTCSMFSNGMIDMLQLSLEVSKELIMAGGPGGSYFTPTITTRTARNEVRWNHITAGVAISPFLTNPPSNAALAGEAAINALSDSVTTWNTLRANGVSIFGGQPPFNHNSRDYARGAMAASIVINSEMTRIHGGNHAMASSLEACHGQDPTDNPPGNTHPHIQFAIVLTHTPIDFQETLNWLTLKYGMLPQANGGYLHSTSATYVTPGTNQAYNVQSMFGSLNYMQKFSMHTLSHSDQREFHSITGYPVSRGGFANVSLSNPKGGTEVQC